LSAGKTAGVPEHVPSRSCPEQKQSRPTGHPPSHQQSGLAPARPVKPVQQSMTRWHRQRSVRQQYGGQAMSCRCCCRRQQFGGQSMSCRCFHCFHHLHHLHHLHHPRHRRLSYPNAALPTRLVAARRTRLTEARATSPPRAQPARLTAARATSPARAQPARLTAARPTSRSRAQPPRLTAVLPISPPVTQSTGPPGAQTTGPRATT
jgi:hypothetical protein